MKRNGKLNLLFLVFLLVLGFGPKQIYATEHEAIDIDLFIDENGHGHFESTYIYDDDEGTEHYLPIGNLGDSEIKDFKVTRNDQAMEDMGSWDVDLDFDEKAGKYGINEGADGYELCFGITDYGRNEFKLSYTITNLVKELNDQQMVYWKFVNDNLSEPPERVSLSISSKKAYQEEDLRMWAFGYHGEINLIDGKIEARNLDDFGSDSHMTILLRFPPNYFATSSKIDEDFSYYKDMAMEGSEYNPDIDPDDPQVYPGGGAIEEKSSLGQMIFGFILGLLPVAITGLILAAFINRDRDLSLNKEEISRLAPKGSYHRDPEDMPIDKFYYLLKAAGQTSYEDYITAFFLKWILENRIEPVGEEKGLIFKKETTSLRLINVDKPIGSGVERHLYKMVESAAGPDRILQEKEFTKYVGKNYEAFERYVDQLEASSRAYLKENGYIETLVEKKLIGERVSEKLTDKGETTLSNLLKFKNYLADFSLLNEKDSVNVHLWDQYMIYAAVFGITERVQKEFEKLYPQYIDQSYYPVNSIYWASIYSRNMTKSYQNAVDASSATASGGFGGGSSFGGGGGSFGGGSGGGTR